MHGVEGRRERPGGGEGGWVGGRANSSPEGLHWGSSESDEDNHGGESKDWMEHGCPALISAGLPQSPRLSASLGHLTRRLLSACSFLCQLCHFVWQSEITPGDAGH